MELKLNRNNPLPVFEQIASWMRKNIHSGIWQNEYKLASETDLAEELKVSRGTIRKAIESLISEKLLVRIHGKGTYVRAAVHLEQQPTWRLAGFTTDLISRGIPFSTEVLLSEIVRPSGEIQKALNLAPSDKIFHMHRLRKINGQPVLLIENHIVYNYCQGIEKIDFSQQQLYKTLEEDFQIAFEWAYRTYRSTSANAYIAKNLRLKQFAPLMYLEELYHNHKDTPIEYTRAWFDAQVFYIKTVIKREDEKSDLNNLIQ